MVRLQRGAGVRMQLVVHLEGSLFLVQPVELLVALHFVCLANALQERAVLFLVLPLQQRRALFASSATAMQLLMQPQGGDQPQWMTQSGSMDHDEYQHCLVDSVR